MKAVFDTITNYWLAIAIIMSLFWGIRGAYLDYDDRRDASALNNQRTPKLYILLNWTTFQFIFNFVGSFAGWICLNILIMRVQQNLLKNWDLSDLFLFIFSFLGITGLLPQSFYGLVLSLERLATAVVGKLIK